MREDGAGRFAGDGDAVGVAAKRGNVIEDPVDAGLKVMELKVGFVVGFAVAVCEDVEAVVDCDEDDRLAGGDGLGSEPAGVCDGQSREMRDESEGTVPQSRAAAVEKDTI